MSETNEEARARALRLVAMYADRSELQERFDRWMETDDGQRVYELIRDKAFRLYDRGWRHFGIAALWEAGRYDRALQVGPNAGFKLNNDFRSRMARLLMADYELLEGFFETRELKA